jgi:hypothetical protein
MNAYRRSGLSLLGYSFAEALAVPVIRIALECAAKSQTKGKTAPVQPVLI